MDVNDVAALDNTWFTAGFQDTASFFAKITTPLVAVATALVDTGWVTLTSGTGTGTYTTANSNTAITVKCRAIGPVAYITGSLTVGTAVTGDTNVTMLTINDTRFVPANPWSLQAGGSGIGTFAGILSTGAVQVWELAGQTLSGASTWSFIGQYPLD